MVMKEMKMHMASPESCFQAISAIECVQEIRGRMPRSSPIRRFLLRDAIEGVCAETLSLSSQEMFSQLGPLNLFSIVSGEIVMFIMQV